MCSNESTAAQCSVWLLFAQVAFSTSTASSACLCYWAAGGDTRHWLILLRRCIANMLRQAQAENLSAQKDILQYIGERFRVKTFLSEWKTDAQVAKFLLKYGELCSVQLTVTTAHFAAVCSLVLLLCQNSSK